MGPSGNRRGKLGKIGTKWDQVETGGENWEIIGTGENWDWEVGPSGNRWGKLGKIGNWTKGNRWEKEKLGPSGNRWGKLGKIGTKWDQVETGEENWGKVGLSGTKWKQVAGKSGENWD